LVSTFYKVDFYTLLSACNEVAFSCKYLLSASLLTRKHVNQSINQSSFITGMTERTPALIK